MLTLLLLAFALSADGFAVAVCNGATSDHRWRDALLTGFMFGLAHAIAVAIGWLVGDLMDAWKNIAPYIACILLVMLGGKMLWESQSDDEVAAQSNSPDSIVLAFLGLLTASIAVSVDAVAAGVTLPLIGFPLHWNAAVIGLIVMLLCTLGYRMGALIGARWGKYAEMMGGLVLIGIGVKFVLVG